MSYAAQVIWFDWGWQSKKHIKEGIVNELPSGLLLLFRVLPNDVFVIEATESSKRFKSVC